MLTINTLIIICVSCYVAWLVSKGIHEIPFIKRRRVYYRVFRAYTEAGDVEYFDSGNSKKEWETFFKEDPTAKKTVLAKANAGRKFNRYVKIVINH